MTRAGNADTSRSSVIASDERPEDMVVSIRAQ